MAKPESELDALRAENVRLQQQCIRLFDERDALEAEIERLRAAVETAAAMVNHADPDLSAALLRLLVSDKRHLWHLCDPDVCLQEDCEDCADLLAHLVP